MARAGLGHAWQCLFANDFDHKKSSIYRDNWGDDVLKSGDIRNIRTSDLPHKSDLVWASFPCQDLSLAGGGAGLKGERSGTFWPFWNIIKALKKQSRAPRIIVLENVCGTLTSHGGKDFRAISAALYKAGYSFGAVVVDAALFVPQSRPRLFIIAIHGKKESLPAAVVGDVPSKLWHTRALRNAHDNLSLTAKQNWIWWTIPEPSPRTIKFEDLIEDNPKSVSWHSPEETHRLLSMMNEVNLSKVEKAKKMRGRFVGAIYRRTRQDENGNKVQRAEIRFDNIAGCLRTPAGGSSRQIIMVVNGSKVKSRLISSRETARLMGLPEDYKLPQNYNEAYHLTGDGVAVPVVRHLAANIFEPILLHHTQSDWAAA